MPRSTMAALKKGSRKDADSKTFGFEAQNFAVQGPVFLGGSANVQGLCVHVVIRTQAPEARTPFTGQYKDTKAEQQCLNILRMYVAWHI